MRALLGAALLCGCYSPRVPAGAPCPDGVCPSGLMCSPATQTCEHEPVAIDATDTPPVDAPDVDASISPIDAATSPYLYRRRITITNNTGAPLPAGYTIRVPLPMLAALISSGKVNADISDLRVIGDGSIGERDRIIDPPGGPAPVAVSFGLRAALPATATSPAYAIYYGRPSAPNPPANGAAVFQVFDDFTANISSVWLQNDGPAANGGKLVLRANHTDAVTTTASTDAIGTTSAFELIATVSDPNSDPTIQPEGTFYYWWGYQHTGDFNASDPWAVWIARGKGQIHGEQKSPVGCEMQCDGTNVTQDANPHYYAIERDPGQTRFYRDGTLVYTATVTNSADYSLIIRNYAAASTVTVDYARARVRVTPEPTISLGPEETL